MNANTYLNLAHVEHEIAIRVALLTNRRAALVHPHTPSNAKPVIAALIQEDEEELDFYRALLTTTAPAGFA